MEIFNLLSLNIRSNNLRENLILFNALFVFMNNEWKMSLGGVRRGGEREE